MLWRAPAKINLTLRILGRRDDGYHELDSIVAKVTLYDDLFFRRRRDGEIRLNCSGFDCGPVEENLVFRAAKLLSENQGACPVGGADIELTKRIPAGAGLGGGSSDAAATLLALNRLWKLDLTNRQLVDLAASLGSDMPLFLDGPAVRMRGRGEIIEPATVHPFAALLYLPDLHCPTAEVYATYDAMGNPKSEIRSRVGQQAHRTHTRRRSAGQLAHPTDSEWRGELFNDLQSAAIQVCPPLAEIFSRLTEATGLSVHLTGSGSAMFVICDDASEAEQAAARLGDEMKERCRVVSLNSW